MSELLTGQSLADFEKSAGLAAAMLKALANENRLMILCKLLEHGEMGVTALSEELGLSQSALSQHLAKMRAEGMLATRRMGQSIFYSVADSNVTRILATLKSIYC